MKQVKFGFWYFRWLNAVNNTKLGIENAAFNAFDIWCEQYEKMHGDNFYKHELALVYSDWTKYQETQLSYHVANVFYHVYKKFCHA